jgi:hypothetical protein
LNVTDDRYAEYGAPPETGPPYDPVQEWRDRMAKSKAERAARYEPHPAFAEAEERLQRAGVRPLDSIRRMFGVMVREEIAKQIGAVRQEINAIAEATDNEFDAIKRQLRQEILAARRHNKRRKKKWTHKQMDEFVMRQKSLPEEAFEK